MDPTVGIIFAFHIRMIGWSEKLKCSTSTWTCRFFKSKTTNTQQRLKRQHFLIYYGEGVARAEPPRPRGTAGWSAGAPLLRSRWISHLQASLQRSPTRIPLSLSLSLSHHNFQMGPPVLFKNLNFLRPILANFQKTWINSSWVLNFVLICRPERKCAGKDCVTWKPW